MPRAALLMLPLLLTAALAADEKKAPAKPSEEVVKAWQKAGFKFGWYSKVADDSIPILRDAPTGLTGEVPAFYRTDGKQFDRIPKLADPKVPFALFLDFTNVTDAGLKEIKGLSKLTQLSLQGTKVTGAGLKEIKGLKNLTRLTLCGTPVTDAGLKEIKGLSKLTHLDLDSTKFTDAGLKEIKALSKLTHLDLDNTQVTDAGLKELAELKNLTFLNLRGAKVTDAGVKGLQKALPKCRIVK